MIDKTIIVGQFFSLWPICLCIHQSNLYLSKVKINQTISQYKLRASAMNNRLNDIIADLHAAENKCQQFEKQYGVLSEFFFEAYTNGWLDDDGNLDFAEWAGYYKSKQDRLRRYRALMFKESPAIKDLVAHA